RSCACVLILERSFLRRGSAHRAPAARRAAGVASRIRRPVRILRPQEKRVRVVGELAGPHLAHVAADRLLGGAPELRVAFHELGNEPIEETEDVVQYENLPVAVASGPDADRRDRQAEGDLRREVERYAFEDDREGAGVLNGEGIREQALPLAGSAA